MRFDGGVTQTIRVEQFTLSQAGHARTPSPHSLAPLAVFMTRACAAQAGRAVACRVQLPLAYGWALSVHKAQGMSLDRVQMSLGKVFECGQMCATRSNPAAAPCRVHASRGGCRYRYVALSRARSLEGLSLIDIDFARLRAHPKVLAFHRDAQLASAADAQA